jgi:hypothetical protein
MISKTIDFIRWLALSDGRVYDCVNKDGLLWRGKISPFSKSFTEAYGFLSLPVALGLLAGA